MRRTAAILSLVVLFSAGAAFAQQKDLRIWNRNPASAIIVDLPAGWKVDTRSDGIAAIKELNGKPWLVCAGNTSPIGAEASAPGLAAAALDLMYADAESTVNGITRVPVDKIRIMGRKRLAAASGEPMLQLWADLSAAPGQPKMMLVSIMAFPGSLAMWTCGSAPTEALPDQALIDETLAVGLSVRLPK